MKTVDAVSCYHMIFAMPFWKDKSQHKKWFSVIGVIVTWQKVGVGRSSHCAVSLQCSLFQLSCVLCVSSFCHECYKFLKPLSTQDPGAEMMTGDMVMMSIVGGDEIVAGHVIITVERSNISMNNIPTFP